MAQIRIKLYAQPQDMMVDVEFPLYRKESDWDDHWSSETYTMQGPNHGVKIHFFKPLMDPERVTIEHITPYYSCTSLQGKEAQDYLTCEGQYKSDAVEWHKMWNRALELLEYTPVGDGREARGQDQDKEST
jgi:hypothetical protein